jgi:hypothetical protein
LDGNELNNAACSGLVSAIENGAMPALESLGLQGNPADNWYAPEEALDDRRAAGAEDEF